MRRSARLLAVSAAAAAVLLALGACGSDNGDESPTVAESPAVSTPATAGKTATGSPSASATEDVKVIEVSMTGSKIDPPPGNVKVDKGQNVKVVITRDSDGEVHVHGYDKEAQAKAGEPVTLEFVADQVGVFEVEAHDPDLLLFKLQVS